MCQVSARDTSVREREREEDIKKIYGKRVPL